MRFPMVQPVTEMTRAALGARLAPGADEYLAMFHDDAVFEFPFGISGPVHIEGKPAMAAHLARIEGATIFDRFDLKAACPIQDDGMVLEYHCQARIDGSGARFEQDYIAVMGHGQAASASTASISTHSTFRARRTRPPTRCSTRLRSKDRSRRSTTC